MWRVVKLLLGIGTLLVCAGCGDSNDSDAASVHPPSACSIQPDCGGDPSGRWESMTTQQCASLAPYKQDVACDEVQFDANNPGQILSVTVPFGDLPATGAVAAYVDGQFSVTILFEGPAKMSFARECLSAPGAPATCEDLTPALITALATEPGVRSETLSCASNVDQGCDCTYQAAPNSGQQGTYVANGSILSHTTYFQEQVDQMFDVRYCVTGETLTLTSTGEGQGMFGMPGVSKLTLPRAPDP